MLWRPMSTHRSPTALLTPAMAGLLDRIARARRAPLHTLSPREARIAYEVAAEVLDLPRAPLARVEELTLPGEGGVPLKARLYAPGAEPRRVLLYLHGGGFVIGSRNTHDSLCRQLALGADCAVVSLEYRLAPEHPFPAAVHDAWAAMQALAAEPAHWGLAPGAIAVGGDSAGATLAATCALRARELGLPLALQLLITPGTAPSAESAAHRLFGHGFLLDRDTVEWFFQHYLAGQSPHDWRFAPLLAEAEGVTPACIVLAECDPLVDDGIAYGDHLRAAGVAVDLHLLRGVTHDFIKMGRALPEARTAIAACAAALRKAFDR
jgi:acetyl esterase